MTCEEVEKFIESDRSKDLTSEEWELVEAHAATCPYHFSELLEAGADSRETVEILVRAIPEESWQKLFEEAGQPLEVIEIALREIREAKRKYAEKDRPQSE